MWSTASATTTRARPRTPAQTLELLGGLEPSDVVMVGDRGSDVAAGRAELEDAGADVLLEHPRRLLELLAG